MYSKIGRPKWILVGQMLKLVGKWPMANCYISSTDVINNYSYIMFWTSLTATILTPIMNKKQMTNMISERICFSNLLYSNDHQLTSLFGLVDFSVLFHSLICTTILYTLWELSLELFKVFHTEVGGAVFAFTSYHKMFLHSLLITRFYRQ